MSGSVNSIAADPSMAAARGPVQQESDSSAAPALAGGLARMATTAMVSAVVVMVAIGVYDVTVRQPRTPRLAVVDVAKLYEMAHERAARKAMQAAEAVGRRSDAAADPAEAVQAGKALAQLYRTPEEFGPALANAMKSLADGCRCTLVAMASVSGADATVPDLTDAAAELLGLAGTPEAAVARQEAKP